MQAEHATGDVQHEGRFGPQPHRRRGSFVPLIATIRHGATSQCSRSDAADAAPATIT